MRYGLTIEVIWIEASHPLYMACWFPEAHLPYLINDSRNILVLLLAY
jgi:hypothetical protein